MLEFWGMRSTYFIAIAPTSTVTRVVSPDRVLSIGQLELFDI